MVDPSQVTAQFPEYVLNAETSPRYLMYQSPLISLHIPDQAIPEILDPCPPPPDEQGPQPMLFFLHPRQSMSNTTMAGYACMYLKYIRNSLPYKEQSGYYLTTATRSNRPTILQYAHFRFHLPNRMHPTHCRADCHTLCPTGSYLLNLSILDLHSPILALSCLLGLGFSSWLACPPKFVGMLKELQLASHHVRLRRCSSMIT